MTTLKRLSLVMAAMALALCAAVSTLQAATPEFGPVRIEATPTVTHTFVSAVVDNGSATEIGPDEWNDVHVVAPTLLMEVGGNGLAVWPSQPSPLTEIFGVTYYRAVAELEHMTLARVSMPVVVAGAGSAQLRVQYTTDLTGATGWAYLDGTTGPGAPLAPTGVANSGWVTITPLAKTTVLLRLIGING